MLCDALVLKTSPYSETSLIVSLLTRDAGVVRALAKGARRIKGRTAAAYDIYSVVRASMRVPSGDGLGNLGSVELKHAWFYLHNDLKRLSFAALGIETLGAVAAASPAEPFFFDEAVVFMTGLEETEAPGSLTACLLLRLLHHAGYPPRLDPKMAKGALPAKLDFDFAEGTFVDRATASDVVGRTMAMPRALVERLVPALDSPPGLDASFVIPSTHGAILLRWLVRVWEDHLNQRIRSWEFLEKTALKADRKKG